MGFTRFVTLTKQFSGGYNWNSKRFSERVLFDSVGVGRIRASKKNRPEGYRVADDHDYVENKASPVDDCPQQEVVVGRPPRRAGGVVVARGGGARDGAVGIGPRDVGLTELQVFSLETLRVGSVLGLGGLCGGKTQNGEGAGKLKLGFNKLVYVATLF